MIRIKEILQILSTLVGLGGLMTLHISALKWVGLAGYTYPGIPDGWSISPIFCFAIWVLVIVSAYVWLSYMMRFAHMAHHQLRAITATIGAQALLSILAWSILENYPGIPHLESQKAWFLGYSLLLGPIFAGLCYKHDRLMAKDEPPVWDPDLEPKATSKPQEAEKTESNA